ncbi:8-oxo-dGDP phosphatase NUDT18 [Chanos chanos]|uniref:8-oxo-dGDP phosphatase NUDT18 n=1 Tax=Chanos chanos TaxID=29144 RepID=A0A6J2URF4_CHACN|nr:8-oxo-dGDP phosphatase NUDT18 [Chanos chanos]
MGSSDLNLDDTVEKLLNGEGVEVTEFDSVPEQVKPVALRKTVCYIVSAIIFNSKKEVLMVQEAKRECYGQWYLPAGRMEEGESIPEALRREVKEEAGLDCQPITMLLVQEQGPRWIRFAFLAEATGGALKTVADADKESLQAQWWDRESPLPLRGHDILPLINAGLKYSEKPSFPPFQPVDFPCHVICQRLLLAFVRNGNQDDGDENHLWLLLSDGTVGERDDDTQPHLPVSVSVRTRSVMWATHRLLRECMPSSYDQLNVNVAGVLGVQHNGRVPGKTDGICFNTLVSVEHTGEGTELDITNPPPLEDDKYRWEDVTNESLKEKILQRIKDVSVLPVQSLYW